MLDHTENQRLRDLLAEIAPLLPEPADGAPPFGADKLRRVLDRVYNRLADEASEPAAPRLRKLLAEVADLAAPPEVAFDECRTRRILDRVQARLAAEDAAAAVPARVAGQKSATRATLRAVAAAFFMPRRLAFGAELLSDDPGPRPLSDGHGEP